MPRRQVDQRCHRRQLARSLRRSVSRASSSSAPSRANGCDSRPAARPIALPALPAFPALSTLPVHPALPALRRSACPVNQFNGGGGANCANCAAGSDTQGQTGASSCTSMLMRLRPKSATCAQIDLWSGAAYTSPFDLASRSLCRRHRVDEWWLVHWYVCAPPRELCASRPLTTRSPPNVIRSGRTACSAGRFSAAGASTCTLCPASSTSSSGAATCTCNAGFSTSGSGASLVCTRTRGPRACVPPPAPPLRACALN